ncbi:MAG: SDR family NAD(P)-dependent oxidoreductase [Alphaproteobacteria bacterium]|nr:SDR family NAD(P)-dependent oxidoreductase [Alphaproteobacteria bacterium]MBO4643001.1 SDR family NAD(P)-dependent oxidoreductase [Alphaproteobacteria bacterium]
MKNPQHILITGASSGIGEALALSYAQKGVTLFLCAQNTERLGDVAQRCREKQAEVFAEKIDVTNTAEMENWIDRCDKIAELDLVIANAGVSAGPGKTGESAEMTRKIFAVNIGGVLNTVLPALEKMKPRRAGQIAMLSSLAGYRGLPSAPAYSGSKNAVRAWGEALRGHLKPQGIEVNVICPGFVVSRITAKNKFPMPFLMPAEQAASIIVEGLKKNKGRITFPPLLAFSAWLMSCLPACVAEFVLTKLPNKGSD